MSRFSNRGLEAATKLTSPSRGSRCLVASLVDFVASDIPHLDLPASDSMEDLELDSGADLELDLEGDWEEDLGLDSVVDLVEELVEDLVEV